MSDYTRTTRECTPGTLHPALLSSIGQYIEKHELELNVAEALVCCETTSTRKKSGLFGRMLGGGDTTLVSGVIVTPGWLIWAVSGAQQGVVTVAARLGEIEVRDYDSSLIPDTGIDVFGFLYGAPERGQIFIGLGMEPAAEHFKQMLRLAVAEAHATPRATPA